MGRLRSQARRHERQRADRLAPRFRTAQRPRARGRDVARTGRDGVDDRESPLRQPEHGAQLPQLDVPQARRARPRRAPRTPGARRQFGCAARLRGSGSRERRDASLSTGTVMQNGMDELVGEFLVESFENLDHLDQDLVALEQDPRDLEVLKSIFRTIHTIKGTCGFLGFSKLESITHVGENLLSLLRDGVTVVDAEIATALLAMTDAVRGILVEIENSESEGDGDYTALVATLERLEQRAKDGAAAPEAEPGPDLANEQLIGELLVAAGDVSEVDVAVGLINQEHGDERMLGEI